MSTILLGDHFADFGPRVIESLCNLKVGLATVLRGPLLSSISNQVKAQKFEYPSQVSHDSTEMTYAFTL